MFEDQNHNHNPIVAVDMNKGLYFYYYGADNKLSLLCSSKTQHNITASIMLDRYTVMYATQEGSIVVERSSFTVLSFCFLFDCLVFGLFCDD